MSDTKHITFQARTEVLSISSRRSERCEYWILKDSHGASYMCFDKKVCDKADKARREEMRVLIEGFVSQKIGGTYLNIRSIFGLLGKNQTFEIEDDAKNQEDNEEWKNI